VTHRYLPQQMARRHTDLVVLSTADYTIYHIRRFGIYQTVCHIDPGLFITCQNVDDITPFCFSTKHTKMCVTRYCDFSRFKTTGVRFFVNVRLVSSSVLIFVNLVIQTRYIYNSLIRRSRFIRLFRLTCRYNVMVMRK